MLKDNWWYCYFEALQTELLQCKDEGKDVSAYEKEAEALNIQKSFTEEEYEKVMTLVDKLEALPSSEEYQKNHPDTLEEIHKAQAKEIPLTPYDKEAIKDRIYGAWIGRITGCLVGKPVENWTRENIRKIAEAGKNYPITGYIHGQVEHEPEDTFFDQPCFTQNCFAEQINGCSPSDDDTNYTVLALSIIEKYGRDFTSYDVVESWLSNFPALALCTAEQAAFRNFLIHILPPRSGFVRNPYREWIGAQIRGDFFGYICPGDPRTAADYAYRDACCTHTKNGIYGEMLISAMIAQSAVTNDRRKIVEVGLACIPQNCRLKKNIEYVIAMYDQGVLFMDAVAEIHNRFPQDLPNNPVHTIPNAMIVVAALLWGEGNYEKTIGYSVMAAMDTDCNGATVGSIIGMMTEAKNIPAHFTDPIADTLRTSIVDNATVRISDLVERTFKLIP